MTHIGEIIKEQLDEHDMTQTELAEMMGVNQSTISSWQVGRTEPDLTAVGKLCEIFQISMDATLRKENPHSFGTVIRDEDELQLIRQFRQVTNKKRKYFLNIFTLLMKVSGDDDEEE